MVELDWEEVSGRNDPRQKFRIYRVRADDGRKPYLLSTCGTEEEVGVAVCEHGRNGELVDAALGIVEVLWDENEETITGSQWLVKPWVPSEWSQMQGKSAKCPECGMYVKLTKDKRLEKHVNLYSLTRDWCDGGGREVKE